MTYDEVLSRQKRILLDAVLPFFPIPRLAYDCFIEWNALDISPLPEQVSLSFPSMLERR